MKYQKVALLIIFTLLLVSCKTEDKQIHVNNNNEVVSEEDIKSISIYQIEIDDFMEAILENGKLIAGEGSEWGTDLDLFIDNVYGKEVVDENSEYFQEMRKGTNKKGITTIEPPIEVSFKNIDDEENTKPIYGFNPDNQLYTVNYRYIIELIEKDQLKSIFLNIIKAVESSSDLVMMNNEHIIDVDTFDFDIEKVIMTWQTSTEGQFLRVSGIQYSDMFLIDITVSNETYY